MIQTKIFTTKIDIINGNVGADEKCNNLLKKTLTSTLLTLNILVALANHLILFFLYITRTYL